VETPWYGCSMLADATTTLAAAFGLGAIVSAVCARIRFPAVLPLLAVGIAVGPSWLGLVDVGSIGAAFRALVSLSIGLLVFEGGLHLDRRELSRAPRAVVGLLTTGVAATWFGATALGVAILGLDLPIALVLGSMLIVTGPTVIQPILRHLRLAPNLHAVLSAEAILIDPIGVVLSVVTMELAMAYYGESSSGAWTHVLFGVVKAVGGGLLVGVAVGGFGYLAMRLLVGAKDDRAPAGPLNVAATGICMLSIAAGEFVAPEGGLVAATITAVILANTRAIASSDVRNFKEQVATLLVGMLFVLLASQIDLSRLQGLGVEHAVFIAALLFLIRPLNVFIGAYGSKLVVRERLFIGAFAPRGIVAASVATLAVARMSDSMRTSSDNENQELLAQMGSLDLIVYATIGISVLWATTAAPVLGRLFGVLAGPPRGVLIVGAHRLGREVARALVTDGVKVLLVDFNLRNCEVATREDLPVLRADATDLEQMSELSRAHEVGWVLAWTGNDDVDKVVARWARTAIGPGNCSTALPSPPSGLVETPNPKAPVALRAWERFFQEGQVEARVCRSSSDGVPVLTLMDGRPVSPEMSSVRNATQASYLVLRASEPPESPIPQASPK
jgi:NhaP-type Na+/H+ or K+/H+ antiporter